MAYCSCNPSKCQCRPRGDRSNQVPKGDPCSKGDEGPEGLPGFLSTAFGFAYSPKEHSTNNGNVKFTVAGSLQNVTLEDDGLRILNSGIYQITYTVMVVENCKTTAPAKFQIMINDVIIVASSLLEAATTTNLNSSQLFSLLEGDIVKLVANVPQGLSYKLPTLQVVRIG